MKVRVSKVTSEYLRDDLCIEAGVWYDAEREGNMGHARFPGLDRDLIILLGNEIGCAHLEDNEQTEWEVSDA